MLRAITFDYWDTIYHGASNAVRVQRRRDALAEMLERLGVEVPSDFDALYLASAHEAARWWRDEHRGYTTADRIRWLLTQLAVERPMDCTEIARAVEDVDRSLIDHPPPLLAGAREVLARLGQRFKMAIVSDTGFAGGRAQDQVLERDALRQHFAATVYSMDVGFAKPRPEPFRAALAALGVAPHEALHVGDIERTDVAGALSSGLRAVRLDAVRESGPSAAEYVAPSLDALAAYLLTDR